MANDEAKRPGVEGLSRRTFLKSVGAGSVGAGLLPRGGESGAAQAAEAPAVVGPGETSITLSINGETREVSVEPRVTLLDALRNRLDLTGSKKVCDEGTCGACTVLYDGEPAYACSILAMEAEGHEITTVEGLGTPDELSAVQECFVKHDALQCGFCTPGFVVACTAYLRENPDPTPEEAQRGLGGNYCRCGTYAGMREAVLDAARILRGGE